MLSNLDTTGTVVEVDGEVPSTGSITFENGKITAKNHKKIPLEIFGGQL